MVGSTLIYYQRVPTDGARRLGCAGILVLCSRLPASGLSRPEARWPDKVLFSAEKSGALRAKACGLGWNGFGASGRAASRQWPAGQGVGALLWGYGRGGWREFFIGRGAIIPAFCRCL